MINLYEYIQEGLLDDFEDLEKAQDKDLVSQWCEENLSGKYKKVVTKDQKLRLWGDVIIKDFKGETFPHQIILMSGNLIIEKCPNLTTLEGLFDRYDTKFEGSLSINNCPKLTSLGHCPFTIGKNLSITGNTSLKSLEGAPEIVHGHTYIMKNGKRFKEEAVKRTIHITTRIVCSVEDEEELVNEDTVNEALNEPHLLELVDTMKKNKLNPTKLIFNEFNIEWDLIDSTNVKEFDTIDAKAKTLARNIIARRDDINGLILLRNKNDEYYCVISHRKDSLRITNDLTYRSRVQDYGYYAPSDSAYWASRSSTELMSIVEQAYSMVIITWDYAQRSSRYKKHALRTQQKDGVVYNDPWYYEQVARNNMERYKKIIAQNKAARKAGDFDKLDKDIELIIQKSMQKAAEVRKKFVAKPNNPNSTASYYMECNKIDDIMRDIYDQTHYSPRGSYGSNGLLLLYNNYVQEFIKTHASGDTYNQRKMEQYKRELDEKIKELKTKLGI